MAIVLSREASSSSSKFKHNYEVFLSFRGEDTRKTFTDHLYTALDQAGIHTFRDDDEIERGKKLGLELRKGIQQSRIAIIVFSKNFANSKWCLNEVLMILEWSKLGGNELVLPIYYDVDPSEVRKQKGSIGESFAKFEEEFIHSHEIGKEKKEEWTQKLNEWRAALKQVSYLTGMVLKNQADGHEAKFIQNIVNVVESKLNRVNVNVPPHLVGTKYRAGNINRWVKDSSSNVQIFVICGLGGIGKTTVAKYAYNQNYQAFDGSCFVASVKECCEHSGGLVKLQMQLLTSILKGKTNEIYNIDEGIIKINQAICSKRVFLVIDDVDTTDQLDALLGTRDFYPGSKIIVTTRDISLLKPCEIYEHHFVEALNTCESMELFSWHAFGKDHPESGYLETSRSVVDYCGGLPLALKVLGSSLSGKSIDVWKSTLAKLKSIPRLDILDILKTSFDSLQDNHDRNLFLHIACFFVGHNKDEAIDILDACGFYTICGIQNLVDKCLVSIYHFENKFTMHQLLQKMGRHIVHRESPNEPWNRSRLWHSEDSFMVLKEKKGTSRTEGLVFDMQIYKNDARESRKGRKRSYDEFYDTLWHNGQATTFRLGNYNFLSKPSTDVFFNCDSFSRMDNLKFLTLNYARVTGSYGNFPEGLKWLCWHGSSVKSISFDQLPLKNIVSLDMSYSKLEHFQIGSKDVESLKILNLSHSERLVKISDIRRLLNLRKLILEGCVSLVDLCDTIGNLERLDSLNLKNCKSLRKFPSIDIRNKCLQSIILDGCINIASDLLKVVDVNDAIVISPPTTFSNPVRKWYNFFKPISRIPQPIGNYLFPALVRLSLRNCNLSDDDFHVDMSSLSALQNLDLSDNPLVNLPPCITNLRRLSSLCLVSCKKLREVLDLPSVLVLHVNDCGSLERVTFQPTSTRPIIYASGCKNLMDVEDTFKLEPIDKVDPKALRILGLDGLRLVRSHQTWIKVSNIALIIGQEEICQVLHEFGILNTFLQREEIPSWYADGSYIGSPSSSVSFVVDSHPTLRVQGLNVRIVNALDGHNQEYFMPVVLVIKISNITKDLSWVYSPTYVQNPGGEEDEFVWLSHWKLGSKVESGDEVHVSAFCSDDFMVKEVGVNLVWGEESHNDQQSYTKGVITGDLSDYQFMSKGLFILLHCPYFFRKDYYKHFFQGLWEEDVWEWVEKRWWTPNVHRIKLG